MFFMITGLALGICCGIVLLIYHEIELLKLMTLSVSAFLSVYIIVSGILFGLDRFSILLSLCISLIVSICFFVFLIMGNLRQKNRICVNRKETLGIIILCACVLPIIFHRNGYFCMAQDEGGYYVKALYIGKGINRNILKASEFETINSEEYSSYLQESIDDIVVGFHDPLHDLEYINDGGVIESRYDRYKEGGFGRFHGILTFPAMLALFGALFGYSSMGYLQLITYYLYVILCFYTLKEMKLKSCLTYLLAFACAVVPPLVWCGKSYLTEMYLAVISVEILMCFLEDEIERKTFALLPIIAFCFYHISAFVFIPLYYVIYLYFFFQRKNKVYLVDNIILIIGYLCGYITNICMNLQYVVSNYNGHLSFMHLNDAQALTTVVFILGILAVGFSVMVIMGKKVRKWMEAIWGKAISGKLSGMLKTGIAVLSALSAYRALNPQSVERSSLVAFICFSGIFVFIIGVIYFFSIKMVCTDEFFCVSLYFLYCIILLSIFYRYLLSFYYGARYIAPYISIIFIFAGMVFKAKETRYFFCEIICLISIKYMLIYDNVLVKHQDDTRVQTEVLLDIMETLQTDDFVFIEKEDYFAELYVPIKLAAQNVYYIKDDLETTLNYINFPEQKRIVVISDQEIMEEQYSMIASFENHISMLADYREVFSDMLLRAQDERMYKDEMGLFYLYEYRNK